MRERPILFNGDMVRAILEGRKTQTRRVIKDVPDWITSFGKSIFTPLSPSGPKLAFSGRGCHPDFGPAENFYKFPFGQIGDRLWVRENWGFFDPNYDGIEWVPDRPFKTVRELKFGKGYIDGNIIWAADGQFWWADEDSMEECTKWKPSIHMPRWASRINLEITNVRVERLKDISNEDVLAEGFRCCTKDNVLHKYGLESWSWKDYHALPMGAFCKLWTSINGEGSWDLNPWVWVIEFKRLT